MYRMPKTEALSPEQLNKLPKWAREHINLITRERDNFEGEARSRNDSERAQGTPQFYIERADRLVWLPEGAEVSLSTEDSDAFDPTSTHRIATNRQWTGTSPFGADLHVTTRGAAAVMPQVSNTVNIVSTGR